MKVIVCLENQVRKFSGMTSLKTVIKLTYYSPMMVRKGLQINLKRNKLRKLKGELNTLIDLIHLNFLKVVKVKSPIAFPDNINPFP